MRVAITGATGNVGTSFIESLTKDDSVDSVVGIARRKPAISFPKTSWVSADITRDDLGPIFKGADVVVHLAWAIQPSHDKAVLWRTNVDGSRRTFKAVAETGVRSLIYASSIGAYSPGPKDRAVDESWPTDGIETSFYARHKAEVERILDSFEEEHPEVRTVRLRKALVFKREAASEIRRLFFGPLLPGSLIRRKLIPAVPDIDRLVFQVVHSKDAGEAYRLAVVGDVRGPFNIAADPVLDPPALARLMGARLMKMSPDVLRTVMKATWTMRLQPTPPGWIDMGLAVPIMDTERATLELGFKPRFSADEAILDLMAGLQDGAGIPTPPLAPKTGGPARVREFLTRIGGSSK